MVDNIIKILERYGSLFAKGIVVTLQFSTVAVLGGVIFGVLLAFMRRNQWCLSHTGIALFNKPTKGFVYKLAHFRPVSFLATAYIEIVRGTPILLHLYIFYFWFDNVITFYSFSKFQLISMALIFNSAAYVSEIFRAGIDAVDHGQMEAARCLGLSQSQGMIKVVIPQAVKNILPALCNEFIMMIKETSLASTFFAGDIMTQYKTVNAALFLVIEPLIIIAVIYFCLTFTLSKIVAVIERRMSTSD